jgi:hypothetical protein
MAKRKNEPSSKQPGKPPVKQTAAGEAHPPGALKDEDFIYVPRGKNRWTYITILVLMIFTLVTFVVPWDMLLAPRGGASRAYMSWEHPRLGERTVSALEFQSQQRELARFFHVFGGDDSAYSEEATARFLVTEALAEEAGVQFGESELAQFILRTFGSKEAYEQRLSRITTPAEFEATAERVLRTDRYQSLIASATSLPGAEGIEEAYNEKHQQYAFDAIGLAVEPLIATARSEATDEEALKTWYAEQPPRSGAFAEDWREARFSVEQVGWRVGSADPAGLLAAYPAPEGTDAAQAARQYYDANFHTRFLRGEPATGPDGEPSLYHPFEEVQAEAEREAPIQRALQGWRDDLATRLAAGEGVDLAAEAASLGLEHVPASPPSTLERFRGEPAPESEDGSDGEGEAGGEGEAEDAPAPLAGFVGRYVEDAVRRADPATGLSLRPVVEKDALLVLRVVEREEAAPAPFDEVRDKVVEEWSKQRASTIALERVRESYENLKSKDTAGGLRPVATPEDFAAEAAAMGVEVEHRDWFDPSVPVAEGVEETPLEAYARRVARRLALAEGELSEPELDTTKTKAWMLRGAGKRPPAEVDIEPREYQELQWLAMSKVDRKDGDLFSFEGLEKRYGLHLASGRADEAPPPEAPSEPEG